MHTAPNSAKLYWSIGFYVAATIALASFLYILGIFLGYPSLITPSGSAWAIPVSAAICVFLSSISILFLLFRYGMISNILGFVILVIGGWRLLELFFNLNLNHTYFFQFLIPEVAPKTYPMAALGAICFTFMGLIFFIWRVDERVPFRIVRLFIAQLVMAIGSIGLLSYALPIDTSFFWEGSPPVNLYVAGCQFCLGIALIATSFYYNTFNRVEMTKVLPTLIAVILFCFTILLCFGMAKSRKQTIDLLLESRGKSNIERTETGFVKYLDSIKGMTKRIEFTKAPPTQAWEDDSEGFVKSHPEFPRFMWLDQQYIVRKIIPKNLDGKFLDRTLPMGFADRAGFEAAMKNNKMYLVFDPEAGSSENYIQIYSPVYWNQTFQGVLSTEIDPIEFFLQSILEDMNTEFTVIITYEDKVIFPTGRIDGAWKNKFWRFKGNLNLGTLVFTLELYPKEEFEGGILNNALLYFTLFGGMLIAASAGGLFSLLGAYKHQLVSLNDLQEKLTDSQNSLTTSLQSGGIGTWIWHIENDQIELDRQGQALFGYDYGTFPGFFANILERTHPQDRKLVEFAMKGQSGDPSKRLLHFQFRVILPNGTIRFLEAKGLLFEDDEGKSTKAFGSLWDVTKTKMTNIRLEVSQEVIRVFSDAITLKEAASRILRSLNNVFGTEIIVIWTWDKKTVTNHCSEIVYMPSVQTPSFDETNGKIIGKDTTIPNHVLATLKPLASQKLTEILPQYQPDVNSPDLLQGIIAFPIFQGTSPVGVVELFKRSPYISEMSEEILSLMVTVGIAVGQFIQKLEAKKAEEQLVSIVTYSADALFLVDKEGRVMNWNTGAEEIFGYTLDEIVGRPVFILFSAEQQEEGEALRASVLLGRVVQHIQLQGVRKNGQKIWIQVSISPINDEEGKPIYASIVAENITAKKEEEDLIRQNEEKFKAIIDTTEDWIWEMDTNRTFLYSSPSATQILGYEVDEIIHKDLLLFLFDEDRQEFEEEFEKHIREKRGWRKRVRRWKRKDGSERWLESSAELSIGKNGQITHIHGTDRDITENLYNERSKNEFLSVISHELKTPLTSIHGALGLLKESKNLPEEAKELLAIAYRNSNRLKNLINDILDIQKFQSKKLLFDLQPVSLDEAIKESIISATSVAQVQQKELIFQDPLPHIIVNSDHERLIQLMGNLISNAIKFSPPKSKITISVEVRDDRVRVSVSDQGKGIPKAFQPRVFEKFARAETGDARTTPGTGLGLSICKGIVDRCGGTIGFQTEENVGTTFYFELPIITKVE